MLSPKQIIAAKAALKLLVPARTVLVDADLIQADTIGDVITELKIVLEPHLDAERFVEALERGIRIHEPRAIDPRAGTPDCAADDSPTGTTRSNKSGDA